MNPVNCVLSRPAEKCGVHWQPDLLIIPNLACGMLVSIWGWNFTIKDVDPNEMFESILMALSRHILSTERLSCLNVETELR